MLWNIITDSSSDLLKYDITEGDTTIKVDTVPFIITVGPKDFVDEEGLDVPMLTDAMEKERKASFSACPSPATWLEMYRREGNVISVAISKELSGSYNSAVLAQNMILEEQPDKHILCINSVSAGPGLVMVVEKVKEAILAGKSWEEVCAIAQKTADDQRTIFALSSYKNLIKNGRMNPLVGFAAQTLGFWGIGVATDIGTIDIRGKMRGSKKAVAFIIDDMKNFAKEHGGTVSTVYISHNQNEETVQYLKEEMEKAFPGIFVEYRPTRGLCGYYAERNGIIASYM